jgi:hypothetical protein
MKLFMSLLVVSCLINPQARAGSSPDLLSEKVGDLYQLHCPSISNDDIKAANKYFNEIRDKAAADSKKHKKYSVACEDAISRLEQSTVSLEELVGSSDFYSEDEVNQRTDDVYAGWTAVQNQCKEHGSKIDKIKTIAFFAVSLAVVGGAPLGFISQGKGLYDSGRDAVEVARDISHHRRPDIQKSVGLGKKIVPGLKKVAFGISAVHLVRSGIKFIHRNDKYQFANKFAACTAASLGQPTELPVTTTEAANTAAVGPGMR